MYNFATDGGKIEICYMSNHARGSADQQEQVTATQNFTHFHPIIASWLALYFFE